ncbi:MAG: phospholipase D family protein [Halioglobus sp.]
MTDTSDTLLGRAVQPGLDEHPGLSGFHLLHGGEDAFARRMRLIQQAERSIDAQYYIWHLDLTGKGMYSALLKAADRGVRVRILLDDLDTAGKEDTLNLIDAHPNIEIRVYNPFANRDKRGLDFITDTARVDHRMHSKTLTVDNQITVFGGRNIGDEYFAATEEVGFSDMDALALGPIVQEVSGQFDLFWNSQYVYPLAVFAPDLMLAETAIQSFRESFEQSMIAARASEYAEVLREMEEVGTTGMESLDLTWSEWFLSYDHPENVVLEELDAATNLAPNLIKAMDSAVTELLIVSPYFVPGEEFTRYLTGRVKQGVKVKILTNSLASNDVGLVHAGYMRYREDLLAGGVDLYEYKATREETLGDMENRKSIHSNKTSLHAKFFGFDRSHMFIGSFNLDSRSVMLNTELGAYFQKPDKAAELSDVFDRDIMYIAYRVQLDDEAELQWTTLDKDGQEVLVDHEPDTGFWKRFGTRIMSPIVPESEL